MKIIWNYDNRKRKKVDKRSLICLGAFVMAFVVLIVTLFDMQILNGSSYANSAVTRKTRTLTVPGTRGKILDSNGIPLAVDEKIYKIERRIRYELGKCQRRNGRNQRKPLASGFLFQ